MDGWVGGWEDGWMDGWMGGWVCGWMDEWVGGWMGCWTDEWMDGQTDGQMNRLMDGWMYEIIHFLQKEEEETAKVLEEFVATFQQTETKRKEFVRGDVINPDKGIYTCNVHVYM